MKEKIKLESQSFVKFLIILAVIVFTELLFKNFIGSFPIVNGDSMNPTYKNGNILFMLVKDIESVERFDVVVVDNGDKLLIKRAIGLPGETVEIKDNTLYIDEKLTPIKWQKERMQNQEDIEITLKDNEIFVMGDNVNNSADSRMFGPFSEKQLKGVVVGGK